MPAYFFAAMFKKSKVGTAPANAPTVDVIDVATNTLVVSGGTPGTLSNMTGVYTYTYTGTAGNYIAMFKTADTTVDSQHVPSYTPQVISDNLDAAVSTRLAAASYSAAPTAAANADAVWDELIAGHTTPLSTGALLSSAGAAADPLLNSVPGSYVAPQAGYYLGRLANSQVNIVSNFDPDTMELSYYYGDDYVSADNRQQTFTTTYTLTGGSVALEVRNATALVSIPCTIVDAHTYSLSLTAANLATITTGVWDYHLRMSLPTSTDKITEIKGKIMVTADVR